VDDSKKIKARFGRDGLARGAAAFAAAMGEDVPATLEGVLARWGVACTSDGATSPWGRGQDDVELPCCPPLGGFRDRMLQRGVDAAGLFVRAVDVPEWNDGIDALRNKANLLGRFSGEALQAALDRWPDEDAEVILDRHGGRLDYGAYIAGLFPFATVTQRPAPRGEALYDVELPTRRLSLRFATDADRRAMIVGWASMVAKLTRDLSMDLLNRWFIRRAPSLKPTAGYRPDGHRFVREVRPILEEARIDARVLVRAL
jgi:hypothetical protein